MEILSSQITETRVIPIFEFTGTVDMSEQQDEVAASIPVKPIGDTLLEHVEAMSSDIYSKETRDIISSVANACSLLDLARNPLSNRTARIGNEVDQVEQEVVKVDADRYKYAQLDITPAVKSMPVEYRVDTDFI